MNQTPPPPLKRPTRTPARMLAWTALVLLSLFVASVLVNIFTPYRSLPALALWVLVTAALLVVLVAGALICFRWLSHWRNLRAVLFGLACLSTLIALFYAEENWRGKHAWLTYRQAQEARGEKFDLAALTPPPVPDEENFALTPLLKSTLDYTRGSNGLVWPDTNYTRLSRISIDLPRDPHSQESLALGNLDQGTFADLKACADFYRGNTNYPQAATSATPAETILTALGEFDADLKELRAAADTRPECRFPIHYDESPDGWSLLLPHLARLKALTRLADLHALTQLETGHPAEALADLKLGLRLSASVHDEPFLVSHMVRVATLAIDVQTVREGLHRHAWDEAQLAEIEQGLSRVDVLAEYKFAMRGDRACTTRGLEYIRRQGFQANPLEYLDDKQGVATSAPPLNAAPGGWICQNLLTISKLHEQFTLPAVDERAHRVFPDISENGKRTVKYMHTGPYTIFAKMLFPALENAAQKPARLQVYVDAARVACALERYRLAEGQLPAELTALVPRFLPAVPNDVIDGQPLRYRPDSHGGYLLYSIGWNQHDDGGQIAWLKDKPAPTVDLTSGDWVWKME